MFSNYKHSFDQSLTWDDPQLRAESDDDGDACEPVFLPSALTGFSHASSPRLSTSNSKVKHSLPRQVSIRRVNSVSSNSGGSSHSRPKTLMKRLSRSLSRSFSFSREMGGDSEEFPGYLEVMRTVSARKSCAMGKIDRSGKFVPATKVR